MQKPHPDLSIAYTGLLAGGNHLDDFPGMIRLFRMAGQVPYDTGNGHDGRAALSQDGSELCVPRIASVRTPNSSPVPF